MAAEALFRAGRQASVQGRHAEACARFKESFRLQPTPGTLLNIGICEEELGRLASAWQRYQGVVDALPASDERTALARSRLALLESRLPRLTLRLAPDAPKNTRVRQGKVELGAASFGLPLPLDPGRHVFTVSAPRHLDRRFVIEIGERERREIVISPGPVQAGESRSAGAAGRMSGSSQRTLAYSLVAAGTAGLLAGALSVGFILDREATVRDHCDASGCDATGLEASRQGKQFTSLAVYGFAIAAAGLTSGVYLMWSPPSASGTTQQRPNRVASEAFLSIKTAF